MNALDPDLSKDRSEILSSLFYPALFIIVMWVMKIAEHAFDFSLVKWGIHPLHINGLPGIIAGTFIHSDYEHLLANSVPLLVLGWLTFYFYKEVALRVFLLIMLVTNMWVWFLGRDSYHIGASGLVYGLASFHLLSGWIRRSLRLTALSFLVIFLYGGMLWGVFPDFFPHRSISWESHLMGALAGAVLSWFYRKSGPQREYYDWEDELDDDNDDDDDDERSDDEKIDQWLQENGKARKISINKQ